MKTTLTNYKTNKKPLSIQLTEESFLEDKIIVP